MATIIRTDEDHRNYREEVAPKNGKDFKLEELQAIVGGYIEIVGLNGGRIMVLNEEGKLDGLPVNIDATAEWADTYGVGTDIIVGNVLICKDNQVK